MVISILIVAGRGKQNMLIWIKSLTRKMPGRVGRTDILDIHPVKLAMFSN